MHDATFRVVDDSDAVVLTGQVPRHSTGAWSHRYPAVYRLDLGGLHTDGRYRVEVDGDATARSPWFFVSGSSDVFGALLRAGVAFDQNQRDGSGVLPGPLDRQPSHLNDAHARLYQWPRMERGSDLILDRHLHRIGGTVDVSGGWFDAGDYLKFTHSTAYNDVLLFSSARLLGDRTPPELLAEARHGLRWLSKMWRGEAPRPADPGRHRLGQPGRHLPRRPRPVAAARGRRRRQPARRSLRLPSTRLPGRSPRTPDQSQPGRPGVRGVRARPPSRTRRQARLERPASCEQARLLYARAATTHPPRPLVTALPHAFYPESSWRDDMQLGAAEIALARHALGQPAGRYLRDSAHWARGVIDGHDTDTLNLYDTSALADASLTEGLRSIPHGRLAVHTRT